MYTKSNDDESSEKNKNKLNERNFLVEIYRFWVFRG